MIVDREQRNRLIEAINRYLNEETTAFDFDEELWNISSEDPTVNFATSALWLLYDDMKDHKVVLSKEHWDFVQRLVLLLKSDAHVETVKMRRWSATEIIAATGLMLFCLCIVRLGLGYHLLVVAVPFGLLSLLLSWWDRRSLPEPSRREVALFPFSSVSELVAVRRRVFGFSKRKYPPYLAGRRIPSSWTESAMTIPACVLLAPVMLLVQSLPRTETRWRVIID